MMDQPTLPTIDEPISWAQMADLMVTLDAADDRLKAAKEEKKEAEAGYKKASDNLRAAGRRVRVTALAERNRVMHGHLAQRHIDQDTGEITQA